MDDADILFGEMPKVQIDKAVSKGVAHVFPSREALAKILGGNKKLTIYLGIDPSGPSLHLGHMVVLRKLKQFQDLGHKIILLIGDFTGTVGDPSGKLQARKVLSREEVLKNAQGYQDQASKILKFKGGNPAELKFNSQWLSKLTYEEILKIASNFTIQQLLERDMFQKRIEADKPIFLTEFIYPTLQGYDSVAMKVDMEVGGSDQIFNMLVGRELVKKYLAKEKFVMGLKLLAVGGVKMGKTESVLVPLSLPAAEMFAKIMALPDEALPSFFDLLTDSGWENIKTLKPMDAKKQLAREILKQLFTENEVKEAQKEFEKVFQKGGSPEDTLRVSLSQLGQSKTISDALLASGLVASKSEIRRLVSQGAIEDEKGKVEDPNQKVHVGVYKIGKYRFIKITA